MKKRFFSALIAAALLVLLLPAGAFAAGGDEFTVGDIRYEVLTDPVGATPGTVKVDRVIDIGISGPLTILRTVVDDTNTYTVTEIGAAAFTVCANLTSITLPNSVTSIGGYAFFRCENLTSASFPAVTHIFGNAFSECSNLASLSLPAAPPMVGEAAFDGYPATRSLTLVSSDGVALTGQTLNNAITAYENDANGYDPAAKTWYGWSLPERVPAAPTITTQPTSQSVTAGNTATFTVEAEGNPAPTYQWQVSSDGTTWAAVTDGTGGTGASYTTATATLAMNGRQYRCVVSNGVAPDAESNAATLTVNAAPPPGPAGPPTGGGLGGSTYTGNEYPGSFAGGVLTVQGNCANLTSVMVDNVILTREVDYTLNCGSTVVTFTPSYLAGLRDGAHSIKVQFTDGRYMGTFTTPFASAAAAAPIANVPATNGHPGPTRAAMFVWFLGGVCCLLARMVIDKRRKDSSSLRSSE